MQPASNLDDFTPKMTYEVIQTPLGFKTAMETEYHSLSFCYSLDVWVPKTHRNPEPKHRLVLIGSQVDIDMFKQHVQEKFKLAMTVITLAKTRTSARGEFKKVKLYMMVYVLCSFSFDSNCK